MEARSGRMSPTGDARESHPTAMSDLQPHPHFDDHGTLHWHTQLEDAKEAARASGKRILIEFGREL